MGQEPQHLSWLCHKGKPLSSSGSQFSSSCSSYCKPWTSFLKRGQDRIQKPRSELFSVQPASSSFTFLRTLNPAEWDKGDRRQVWLGMGNREAVHRGFLAIIWLM
jgi:hypothetical protein